MPLSITPESKNALTITNESKGHPDLTLEEMEWTLKEAEGTLAVPHIHLIEETKNNLTISNETKN